MGTAEAAANTAAAKKASAEKANADAAANKAAAEKAAETAAEKADKAKKANGQQELGEEPAEEKDFGGLTYPDAFGSYKASIAATARYTDRTSSIDGKNHSFYGISNRGSAIDGSFCEMDFFMRLEVCNRKDCCCKNGLIVYEKQSVDHSGTVKCAKWYLTAVNAASTFFGTWRLEASVKVADRCGLKIDKCKAKAVKATKEQEEATKAEEETVQKKAVAVKSTKASAEKAAAEKAA